MPKRSILLIYTTLILKIFAQNKMQAVDELINKKEPGWKLVK
jgi:hypothetical protein